MDRPTGREAYRAARDMLLRHRDDYDAAVAAFRWPGVGDRFNWALDWFDPIAAGNPRTALRIIDEDGTDRSYSFAEMAARSDRLATSLRAGGVTPGDRVMVMLGNQVELWESMLAVMKLGAVIMPATTALGPKDLADRVGRARFAMSSPMPTRSTNSLTSQGISAALRSATLHRRGGATGWPTKWPRRHCSARRPAPTTRC
jgi:non-ribosomal peptide synthetase component F